MTLELWSKVKAHLLAVDSADKKGEETGLQDKQDYPDNPVILSRSLR